MLKKYVALTKPGIIMGNLVAACSGFFLASQGDIDWLVLVCVALGTSMVVGSGCVFNNYIDKDIDSKMERTMRRGFVLKTVHVPKSLIFATFLGMIGVSLLHVFTNWYAVFFAVFGFFVYVCLYSLKFKRSSVHGTLIGSASGACPPVIGYVAVTNHMDGCAVVLFLIYCIWQLPHSYAIATYRKEDYQAANIPVLPVVKGIASGRKYIIAYIALCLLSMCALTVLGYTGYVYLVAMLGLNGYWLYVAITGYKEGQQVAWGKRLFLMSIIIIMAFSVLISLNHTDITPAPIQLFT